MTNKTKRFTLIGAAACSFFFGLGQHETPALVFNCVNSCCEVQYCWWVGDPKVYLSAQVSGAMPPFVKNSQNDVTAVANINVAVASGSGCNLPANGNYDQYSWDNGTAYGCADPTTKKLLVPQQASPAGDPTPNKKGAVKNKCSN